MPERKLVDEAADFILDQVVAYILDWASKGQLDEIRSFVWDACCFDKMTDAEIIEQAVGLGFQVDE